VTIFGDGEQTRDMVFVKDVAAANVAAAGTPLPPLRDLDSRAYNIGTGVETSVNRLVALMEAAAGRPADVRRAPGRAGELLRNALDPAKAGRELGWTPRTDLAGGLAATIRWIKEG
jgi:UDP-glucose 4-epimerase